jgi:hypothetical protein
LACKWIILLCQFIAPLNREHLCVTGETDSEQKKYSYHIFLRDYTTKRTGWLPFSKRESTKRKVQAAKRKNNNNGIVSSSDSSRKRTLFTGSFSARVEKQ